MEYTLIVFCLSAAEADLEFNKRKCLLKDIGSIEFNNSSKTIRYKGKSIMFVSHRSNVDGIYCKEYQLSSGLSRKATNEEFMNVKMKGDMMRAVRSTE